MTGPGYSEQEINEVSDRLVDAMIGHADASRIDAKIREHLAAGADHVIIWPTARISPMASTSC